MNKKNIWIINQVAGNPESGWGERHYYLSKKWIDEGYRVNIISGSFNHMFNNFPETKGQFTIEDYQGTNFCWVKCPKYNPKSIFRFYSMIIFAIKVFFTPASKLGKPDVILMSSMPIFPIFSSWLLKLRYGSKLIFEVRDLWPLTPIYLMGFSKWHPMIWVIGMLEKLGYRQSNHIVSVLPNSSEYIDSISKKPEKFNYIPNGISEELLVKEKLPDSVTNQLPKDKFIIGYTGTMGLANALEHFVDAAVLLKDNKEIFFVLVGDGYIKEDLQKVAKDLSNIIFIPKIKKDQVQHMLSLFDVCFIGRRGTPLFDHGVSSNKYFDYMLAVKPVLVSSNKIKDPVELADSGIIVEPDSAKSIMEGILLLHKMTIKEREELGKKGYEYVKEYHNFNYLSDKYSSLF